MRVRQKLTASGFGTPIGLDIWQMPFDVGYSVEVPGGTTASVTVQFTPDNLNDPSITTPTWFNDTTIATASASTAAVTTVPYSFIRLNVVSISGGPVYFTIIQGMSRGV